MSSDTNHGVGGPDPSAVPDGKLRESGRRFLLAIYRALRTIKLYPIENQQTRSALDELTKAADSILKSEGELEVRISGELLYLNSTRIRLSIDNYVSFGHVLSTLHGAGIGVIRIEGSPDSREWQVFLSLLLKFTPHEHDPDRIYQLQKEVATRNLRHISVGPPAEGEIEFSDQLERKRAARRTYEESVAVTKKLFSGSRIGRSAQVKQIKRVVQNIVDQVLNNEASLMGLSTLRDYDDYTFTHSVNVCILCVAIGKRLGLSKRQLYDLGLAALAHDIGMSRISVDIVAKDSGLTEEERTVVEGHTWLGALSIFNLREYGEIPLRSIITAYEHHMKVDLSGYPKIVRPRQMSVFSKIIAVADAFDAGTYAKSHKAAGSPDEILREIWENEDLGYDPVLVKALINLLGVYPVGTCVILDTYELAIVHAANSDVTQLHRPIMRIVGTADGEWISDPPLVDLAETDSDGTFQRTIIKVTNPDRYDLRVSDYLV